MLGSRSQTTLYKMSVEPLLGPHPLYTLGMSVKDPRADPQAPPGWRLAAPSRCLAASAALLPLLCPSQPSAVGHSG